MTIVQPDTEHMKTIDTRRQHGDLRAYTIVDWAVITTKATIGIAIAELFLATLLTALWIVIVLGLAILGSGLAAGN